MYTVSFLWCSLRCLRCLLVGLWPCCASTLDSTERSHGPWPVGVRTGSTSLGNMAQKFKLNPKTGMKFHEIFIHQHHRITSIRMAANLCNNATKMYQIWSEQCIGSTKAQPSVQQAAEGRRNIGQQGPEVLGFWFGRHGFSDFHSECRLSTATGLPAIFKCFFFKALGERHCSKDVCEFSEL